MANLIVLVFMRFFHNLFTVTWIGGMIALALSVMPAVRKSADKPEKLKILTNIQQRMNKIVVVSIVGLFLTGILMSNASPLFQGYLSVSNQYSLILSVKHVVVGAMVAITFVRNKLASSQGASGGPKQSRITAFLLIVNIVLGLVVLLLSGWTAALTSIQANS